MEDLDSTDSTSILTLVKLNSFELVQSYFNNLSLKSSSQHTSFSNSSVSLKGGNIKRVEVELSELHDQDITNLEERDSRGRTALHLSSIRGTDDIMRLLLEKGGDVSAVDFHGNTPLHYSGHTETIQCLLEYGADIFAK